MYSSVWEKQAKRSFIRLDSFNGCGNKTASFMSAANLYIDLNLQKVFLNLLSDKVVKCMSNRNYRSLALSGIFNWEGRGRGDPERNPLMTKYLTLIYYWITVALLNLLLSQDIK